MIHHTGPGWRLIHGDAYQAMAEMPADSVDLVLTDPPFDAHTHQTFGHRDTRNGFRSSEAIPFAPLQDIPALVAELLRISRGWVLCFCAFEQFGAYQSAAGKAYRRSCIWVKPNGIPQFTGDRPGMCGEGIAVMWAGEGQSEWNGKGRHGIWTCDKPKSRQNRHPCEKPVPLIDQLLADFAKPSSLILDPFAGSAAIGKAALGSGHTYIGMELSDRFAKDAIERLQDSGGGPMFLSFDNDEPAPWLGLEN